MALMIGLENREAELQRIWQQSVIAVAYRSGRKGEPLLLKLPYLENNRAWLKGIRRTSPKWISDEKYWELPKTWFNDIVEQVLNKHRKIYIIQPYREQEKCAPACMHALGHICQCSCMGANHGIGIDGSWFEVSETFATRWGEQELACRLMTLK